MRVQKGSVRRVLVFALRVACSAAARAFWRESQRRRDSSVTWRIFRGIYKTCSCVEGHKKTLLDRKGLHHFFFFYFLSATS